MKFIILVSRTKRSSFVYVFFLLLRMFEEEWNVSAVSEWNVNGVQTLYRVTLPCYVKSPCTHLFHGY